MKIKEKKKKEKIRNEEEKEKIKNEEEKEKIRKEKKKSFNLFDTLHWCYFLILVVNRLLLCVLYRNGREPWSCGRGRAQEREWEGEYVCLLILYIISCFHTLIHPSADVFINTNVHITPSRCKDFWVTAECGICTRCIHQMSNIHWMTFTKQI